MKRIAYAFLLVSVTLLAACNKDDGGVKQNGTFSKARISDAKALVIGKGMPDSQTGIASRQALSSNAGVLMKQTDNNSIEPVFFILSNGDSLTLSVSSIVPANDTWVLLDGGFSTGGEDYKILLVNKDTEAIYGIPHEVGANIDLNSLKSMSKTLTYTGNQDVLYLPTFDYYGDQNIYKIDLSGSSAVGEKYLPDNQHAAFFCVSREGLCLYHNSTSNSLRFKLPSGKIVMMDEEVEFTSMVSDLLGNTNDQVIRNQQFYIGQSGELFCIKNIQRISEPSNNRTHAAVVIKIGVADNQLTYHKVADYILGQGSDAHIYSPMHNLKRGTIFFSAKLGNSYKILEHNESNDMIQLFSVNNAYGVAYTASNFIVNVYDNSALSLNDYSETSLAVPTGYEIYSYNFSNLSDDYSCSALELNSGNNGIAEFSINSGFIGFTQVNTSEKVELTRIN